MKGCRVFVVAFSFLVLQAYGQRSTEKKVRQIFENKSALLKKEFQQRGLTWPAKQLYIRSFKKEGQLEVWIRQESTDAFRFFKTYTVCAVSGSMGPKRRAGDYQVPEGFYYINEFRPNSQFHLALGLNYPNASDDQLSDAINPGNEIFIHGGCITVGCIPVKDAQIEELYVLASMAKQGGQDFIPVHIFPMRFDDKKSEQTIRKLAEYTPGYDKLSLSLKKVYDYFELHHKIPLVAVDALGQYLIFD